MIPQQQRSEETRMHLIEAALRCFSRQGYDATGVAKICAEAGVSKGAFYHHFPTKQALFLELLETWLAQLDRQLAAVRTDAPTISEGLRRMAGAARQVFDQAEGQLPMFLEFWNQARRDPQIWEATAAPYRRYCDEFTELIRAGIAEGSLRPVDPAATARTIVSLAVGMLLQGTLDPQKTDWGDALEKGIALLLEGLEVKPLNPL